MLDWKRGRGKSKKKEEERRKNARLDVTLVGSVGNSLLACIHNGIYKNQEQVIGLWHASNSDHLGIGNENDLRGKGGGGKESTADTLDYAGTR